jgi:excisionase family DNA binding protein
MGLARTFTVPEVAERLGVNGTKVRAWIGAGELRALNVAASRNGRPRWRIDPADLAAFERSRQGTDSVPKPTRRRQQPAEVIEFF